jgi:rhodanese-related sulfurtransferase
VHHTAHCENEEDMRMDPKRAYARRDELQILDVREGTEWDAGRIDGAVHIPLRQLPTRLGELDRSRPVAAICRSGNRSGMAVDFLAAQGLSAENVEGGMKRWAKDGLPFSAPDGNPGRVA